MEKELIKDKSLEERMDIAGELGKGYFKQGLNCTECVLKTFMDMYDVNLPDEVLCMATGFGGGMGGLREVCGAFSGMVLVYNYIYGFGFSNIIISKRERLN